MVSICFSIVCMTTATRIFRYLVNKDGSMVNVCSSICTTHCCKCNVTSPTRFHKISPSIKTMQPIVCTQLFLIQSPHVKHKVSQFLMEFSTRTSCPNMSLHYLYQCFIGMKFLVNSRTTKCTTGDITVEVKSTNVSGVTYHIFH